MGNEGERALLEAPALNKMIFYTVRKVSYYVCLSALAQAGEFFKVITDFGKNISLVYENLI